MPHLADIEVASVARGLARAGTLTEARGLAMLTDLSEFPARRWEAGLLLERIWQLRATITAYDAVEVYGDRLAREVSQPAPVRTRQAQRACARRSPGRDE